MGWPSGVTRTRIRVTGVNFSEFLITRKGNLVRVIAGNLSYQSSKWASKKLLKSAVKSKGLELVLVSGTSSSYLLSSSYPLSRPSYRRSTVSIHL